MRIFVLSIGIGKVSIPEDSIRDGNDDKSPFLCV